MAKNQSVEINFQHYVDLVKQENIQWNTFIDFVQELSYSNMDRLRNLNATLLNELTINYSDMDKFKYLNGILLSEFKNYIQRECETEMIENDVSNILHTKENHFKKCIVNQKMGSTYDVQAFYINGV